VEKRGRLGRVVRIALLATAVVLVGALGVGFILYDRATRLDRSAPDVAVDNYLRALLVDRDDTRASLYACGDDSGLSAIHAFRDDVEAREDRFDASIDVSWGGLAVDAAGDRATVDTEIRRTVGEGAERDVQSWRFVVISDGGWRVCEARRVR
jgi:hypothetical protein